MKRTLANQALDEINSKILLKGWVSNQRIMGKMIFIDLRDRTGEVQCVGLKNKLSEDLWKELKSVTIESVVELTGEVNQRPNNQINQDLETGSIEIEITDFRILNKAVPLPIPVHGDGYDINEESRLKYRYLDLRRGRLSANLKLRSELASAFRDHLLERDFIEVETPMLTASTKEGSRDFVVPSRINPGKFYALPQSPQQYKQLLMTAGIENYFQLARCIRDEDLRADRGFEHTQVDIETSFRSMEEIMDLIENMVISTARLFGKTIKEDPIPKFTYAEAIDQFGADKFDLRAEQEKKDGVLAFAWVHKFPFFKEVDTEDKAEVVDGKSGWTFTHNPFSMPEEQHLDWHLNGEHIGDIITQQYDLVCNGYEIGGGSVRAHRPDILKATYKIMGYTDEQIEEGIGHMLKAFEVGTPPHGGIALGLDRLVMIFSEEDSLKEIIAFPMTYNGRTSVMQGPSEISEEQRTELGLHAQSANPVEKTIHFLETKGTKFETLEHEPTPTSEDSAKVRNMPIEQGIKALIVRGKKTKKNWMIGIPAHLKLDTKAIKSVVGEDIEFEKPDVIKEKYGLVIGGVPPVGEPFGLKTYWDEGIFKNETVSFNAGSQIISVIISSEEFKKVIDSDDRIGIFTKS